MDSYYSSDYPDVPKWMRISDVSGNAMKTNIPGSPAINRFIEQNMELMSVKEMAAQLRLLEKSVRSRKYRIIKRRARERRNEEVNEISQG